MASIGTADTCCCEVAAVGIGRITLVAVLQYDIVILLLAGQGEFAFSVSHPDTEFTAAETAHQHALVGLYSQTDEVRLELVTVVMQHAGFVLWFVAAYETQFHHQLTAVAYTQ